jgi:hypothetical protein
MIFLERKASQFNRMVEGGMMNRQDDSERIYYKYCDLSIYELENLIQNQIHFSPVRFFNDPADTRFDIRPKMVEEIPGISEALLSLHIKENDCDHALIRIGIEAEKCIYVSSFIQTDDPDDPLMWGYYANKSKGLRVAYDFRWRRPDNKEENSFEAKEQQMDYDLEKVGPSTDSQENKNRNSKFIQHSNDLAVRLLLNKKGRQWKNAGEFFAAIPRFILMDRQCMEDIRYCAAHKSIVWEKENEIRLLRLLPPHRSEFLTNQPLSLIKEAAVGPNVSSEDIRLLKTLLNAKRSEGCDIKKGLSFKGAVVYRLNSVRL